MSPWEDEDGIDGPFERAFERAMAEDAARVGNRHLEPLQLPRHQERPDPAGLPLTGRDRTAPDGSEGEGPAVTGAPMWAITLQRPWPSAIFELPEHLAKRVENRNALPYKLARGHGRWLAIHAGQRYARGVVWPDGLTVPEDHACPGGIVGVVRIVGALDRRMDRSGLRRRVIHRWPEVPETSERVRTLDRDPWWMGPVGWLFGEVIGIEAVPCRGAQGFWRVPAAQAAEVRRRVEKVRAQQASA